MKYLAIFAIFLSFNALAESFYDFKIKDTNGGEINFGSFKGKTVLVANIATKCGFTGQLDDLEKLFLKYKDKNFVVIGIPSNNFLSQTPEDNKAVGEFCRLKYGVSFPITEKVEVIGDKKHPIIKWINSQKGFDGSILWNFEKFIINKNGNVVDRFRSNKNPMDEDVLKVIEKNL
jgi:glutathione peroxidase